MAGKSEISWQLDWHFQLKLTHIPSNLSRNLELVTGRTHLSEVALNEHWDRRSMSLFENRWVQDVLKVGYEACFHSKTTMVINTVLLDRLLSIDVKSQLSTIVQSGPRLSTALNPSYPSYNYHIPVSPITVKILSAEHFASVSSVLK